MPEKSNRRTVMEHFNPILGYETTGPKFITCGEIMLPSPYALLQNSKFL